MRLNSTLILSLAAATLLGAIYDVHATGAWYETAPAEPTYLLVDKQTNELKVLSAADGHAYGTFRAISGLNSGDKEREGDKRTPEGIYFVTREIPKGRLLGIHGPAAYELDYPNIYDHLKQHTGSGIWIHGVVADTRMEKRFDTLGCVALANSDIVELRKFLKWRETAVVIVDHEDPAAPVGLETPNGAFAKRVNDWVEAWSSKDPEKYLAFYDENFHSKNMDFAAWTKYKTRVAKEYKEIKVQLSNVKLYVQPKYAVATFDQDYTSDRFHAVSHKRLYLVGPASSAKILAEEVTWEK